MKVEVFGFDDNMNYVAKQYSCTVCKKCFNKLPIVKEVVVKHSSHTEYVESCFGCKSKTLQLATGDASGNIIASGTTQKKWTKELDLYASAVKQGVQPSNTTTPAIHKALDISNKTGRAFDASKDVLLDKKGK